ncbi:SDR family NAD(P)-dependent oxidoreductase [Pantoea cypripedii]|uniref:Oxidoreductase n=1 Tax=Pantoea cypripedii TaxID=55209 RepID=A0A1X1ELL8_PANCY|nr:SDR family oxidoreductase [Pantoea cypripedii]MBP2200191.1 NAD(P)-dependent dehydrogenase (short-subunit alcohol dehydrogenase family) [Pantoea cypripedii]ORM89789.1 oxidoreductase [Pantoea cypripedii]
MDTKGKVYIVTGSATGVGAATVLQLAQRGARLVINFTRSQEEAAQTAAACEAYGAEVELIQADVAQDDQCRRLVNAAIERWGRLDGLVNNAGVTVKSDPFDLETLSADDFQRVFGVNVVGCYQMCRAALPWLRESQGSVVNVSSHVAFTGGGSSLAYTASKGAINALTLALARTLAPEVRVNAVCPGVIDTRWMRNAMGEDAYASFAERQASMTPLGRVATAEDVAQAIVWLLQGADFITGELLCVDGGFRLMGGLRKTAAGSVS